MQLSGSGLSRDSDFLTKLKLNYLSSTIVDNPAQTGYMSDGFGNCVDIDECSTTRPTAAPACSNYGTWQEAVEYCKAGKRAAVIANFLISAKFHTDYFID